MVCLKWPVEVMLITLELIVAMEKGIEEQAVLKKTFS